MCNTNCCKKEEDLICAMPIPFCGCDKCCPIPCGGCFKDDSCCGCCCDCDDSCCYCKYYKMLKELRDQLQSDENKITSLLATDKLHETKIENYYLILLNKIAELIGTDQEGNDSLLELIRQEQIDRVHDVDDEEDRAKGIEDELRRLIQELREKEIKDHNDQKEYIDNWIHAIMDDADLDLDSFYEVLQRILGDESDAMTLLLMIEKEILDREDADDAIKERVKDLEDLTAQTENKNIDLVFGHAGADNRDVIATVNGVDITVGLPNIPTMHTLTFTGGSNVTYDGSQNVQVAIPTSISQLGGDNCVVRIDPEDNNGDTLEYETVDGNLHYITVPYAVKSTNATNAENADLSITHNSNGDTIQIGNGTSVQIRNARNAKNATNDGNGDNIVSTYLKKSEGVTAVGIDNSNQIYYTINGVDTTLTTPYLTSHLDIKTLKTNNSLALNTEASESITGTGTINLHKISKTGNYDDLRDRPSLSYSDLTQTVPQNGETITSAITLHKISKTGSYSDLEDKPTIPAALVQSNWTESNSNAISYILNKPALAAVAISGDYGDLLNTPTIPTVPSIGSLNTNNSSGLTVSSSESFSNSISLHKVSKTGSYTDLLDKPTIPTISATIDGTTYTTLQGIVDAIIAKILWEPDSNDNTKIIAKNSKAAEAAGFYDTTVS